jgi:NadR type nicotinamide-nucleotide adenylyltransferase
VIRVCFHGAESTGKSTLVRKLGEELGCPVVPEYGRAFAETCGIDFGIADLLAMAREQDRLMRKAATLRPKLLLLDTDPLMTAAWSEMLFGEVPGELLRYEKAELYLVFAPDVAWVADGTRFFGTAEARARFADIAEQMLVRTGVPYCTITGGWDERERQVRAIIQSTSGTSGAA